MIMIILPDLSADEHLLRDAKKNKPDALKQIYERYFPPVFRFIVLRTADREQARDITADVFLDFFAALRGNNPPRTHLRGWLFRVARNKLYDHYGHDKQMPTTTLDEWTPLASEHSTEATVMHNLRIEKARQLLGMLVSEQQEVLILRFGQGLSLRETADTMDKSVSAVKSLQFRAVDTLRQLMGAAEME